MSTDKKADLAGPGVSTYEEVDKILPAATGPARPQGDAARVVPREALH